MTGSWFYGPQWTIGCRGAPVDNGLRSGPDSHEGAGPSPSPCALCELPGFTAWHWADPYRMRGGCEPRASFLNSVISGIVRAARELQGGAR